MLSALLIHKEEQGSAYSFHTVQTREEAELEELMSSLGDRDTFYQNKHSKREERDTVCAFSIQIHAVDVLCCCCCINSKDADKMELEGKGRRAEILPFLVV